MSYILDALRKAESERERGKVPGLNAQTQDVESSSIQPRPWWARPLMWAGVGLCAGLLVAGTVRWLMPNSPAALPPQAANQPRGGAPVGVESAQAPQPSAHTTRRPPSTDMSWMQPLEPEKDSLTPAPAAAASASLPSVAQVAQVPSRPEAAGHAAPTSEPRSAPPVVMPRVSPRSAPASSTTAASPPTIQGLSELPEDVRRQLPSLSIGGSSYSESPAARLLIVNGQVFHEGDQLTGELRLEHIELKAAVLSFKGYRYRVTF